ncbi:MAG: RHS repeat-associated core domain-containing protein [Candidatus Zixiibacteriota bacterium]
MRLNKTGKAASSGDGGNTLASTSLNVSGLVDLFSGQHKEMYNLLSIQGRNGMNVDVALSYFGAVKNTVHLPNYQNQVSEVGLGFRLPLETIQATTFGTIELTDDKYLYFSGDNVYELISTGTNTYTTITGQPWIITRHTGSVAGITCVIGWTIKKENGEVYTFGDLDDGTLRNATRYGLRWENSLLPAASRYPELYPTQWDLASLEDAEGLNSIEYSYNQELATVTVFTGYSSASTVSTFTRASHISEITVPGGESLRFTYSSRQDYSRLYYSSKMQYYSTLKLDSIIAMNADGVDVSGVLLTYSYLNPSGDDALKKLVLTNIYQISVLGDSELPPVHFDYYTNTSDINFGAIKSVTNPNSGTFDIAYDTIESDSNFADLSVVLSEDMERYNISVGSDLFYLDRSYYIKHSTDPYDTVGLPGDVSYQVDSTYYSGQWHYSFDITYPDNKDLFGTWNGFWDWESISHSSNQKEDFPIVSSDGWMARYDRANHRIVVRRWMDGYWKVENVPISWTPVGARVKLIAGNDYIMAYDNDATFVEDYWGNIYFNGWQTRYCYMYKYDDGDWIENKLYKYNDAGNWGEPVFILNYNCSPDLAFIHFGRNYSSETRSKSIYAKYQYGTQTLSIAPNLEAAMMQYVANDRAMQSDNICVWPVDNGLYGSETYPSTHLGVTEWSGSSWLAPDTLEVTARYYTYSQYDSLVCPKARVIAGNVIFWEKYRYSLDYGYYPPDIFDNYVVSAVRGPSGWVKTPQRNVYHSYSSGGIYYDRMFSADNLVVTEHNNDLRIWQWVGAPQWAIEDYGYVQSNYQLRAFDNLVVTLAPNGVLKAKRLLGDTTWTATETLLSSAFVGDTSRYDADTTRYIADPCDGYPSAYAFTVQEDYIVAMNNATKHVILFVWEEDEWVDYDLSGYMTTPSLTQRIQAFSSPTSFYIAQKLAHETKYYCFKRYGKQFAGKAVVPVVDHILAYRTTNDTLPVRVDLSYYGALLDKSSTAPRFARTSVSLPYFDGIETSDGFQVHCFYNDIDNNTFSVSGIPGFTFPDLESSSIFGLSNGGYLLDGLEYLQYSYSAGDNSSVCNDSIRSYYSVYHPDGYPDQVFRIQLDSVHTRKDLLASDVRFTYESEYGRGVATRTLFKNANTFMVDSVEYAADLPEYSDMLADNALTQISKRIRLYDSSGTLTVLKKEGYEFEKHGNWTQTQSHTWTNPTNEYGMTIINDILGDGSSFNQYGSVVASKNGMNEVSSVKLDKNDTKIIANAANCTPNEFLLQDFEQGYDWDGWVMLNDYHHQIIGDDAFTGNHSFRIRENTNSTDHNWGPKRNISVDSLSPTRYYFSAWVKASHTVNVYCFAWDSYGYPITVPHGTYEFSNVSDTQWTKIQGIFDLSGVYYNMDEIQFRIALKDFGTCPPDAWALFDDVRFHPCDAEVNSNVYDDVSGRIVAMAGPDNVATKMINDTFGRDSLSLNHRNEVLTKTDYSMAPTSDGLNWIKSTIFRSDSDSTVSVSFFDGFGRIVQTRTGTNSTGAGDILVTDIKEIDSRDRVVREYLPYTDLIAPSGLFDYSNASQVASEMALYYSASGPGADCDGYPYKQIVYSDKVVSRVDSTGNPGETWNISSGHVNRHGHRVDVANELIVDSLVDADSVVTLSMADKWGRFSKSIARYDNGSPRQTSTIKYTDLLGRDTAIYIDTLLGTAEIPIQRNYYNTLSRIDSTWNRDQGMIRIIYDRVGRVRFTQNGNRSLLNQFVYFKYDENGHKIEEGVMDSANMYFNQTWADVRTFPFAYFNPDVKYRWMYNYIVNWYNDTLLAPSMLIRTENTDSSYYREYAYYPERNSDTIITKLPNLYYRKAIGHVYDRNKNLIETTLIPRYPSTTGIRRVNYEHDKLDRTTELISGNTLSGQSKKVYARYGYDARSEIVGMDYGLHAVDVGGGVIDTTIIQPYTLSYNSRGNLISINDINDVDSSSVGGGADSIHFAQTYEYGDTDPSAYFNGRVRTIDSRVSGTTGLQSHGYRYTYNDLGYLVNAEHLTDTWRNCNYDYNALGMRMSKTENTVVTDYIYWTNTSRLAWYTGCTIADFLDYDAVGNLTRDSRSGLYQLQYNYRNLLEMASLEPNLYNGNNDTLYFAYDEAEQRIVKRYTYQILVDCDPPDPYEVPIDGGKSLTKLDGLDSKTQLVDDHESEDSTEKKSCKKTVSKETYYLYDRGIVIATFDKGDIVAEYYIPGPTGRIATYRYNSDNYFYYNITDHQESNRLTMSARFGYQPYVAFSGNYMPFAKMASSSGNYYPRFTYSDKELDQASSFDLFNFGSRYYNPETGQFITADKKRQYPHRYMFAGNSPVLGMDPDGNFFWAPIITAAAFATMDVAIAASSGERNDLFQMWLSSFTVSMITYGVAKVNPLGKLGSWSSATEGPLSHWYVKYPLKGAYYSAKAGNFMGKWVNRYNAVQNVMEGNFAGAYFTTRYHQIDKFVAGTAFMGTYASYYTGNPADLPNLATWESHGRHRMAIIYKGGLFDYYTGRIFHANGISYGHNILLNGEKWKRMNDEERAVLLRHEFVHTIQSERFGPALNGLYLYENWRKGSIPEPDDIYSMEHSAWWRALANKKWSHANKFEYEAYIQTYTNSWGAEIGYIF